MRFSDIVKTPMAIYRHIKLSHLYRKC